MKMMVLAKRLTIALERIEKEKLAKINENLKEALRNKIVFESEMIIFKLKQLTKKYRTDDSVATRENTKEFLELVRTHRRISKNSDACYFPRSASRANMICATIAVDLSRVYKESKDEITDGSAWKILIDDEFEVKNDVTKNYLLRLRNIADPGYLIPESIDEKALQPWQVVASEDGKSFIEIYTCLNTFIKNGFVHTSDTERKQKLSECEIQAIKKHSIYTEKFCTEYENLTKENDNAGIARLKRNFKTELSNDRYEADALYGENGLNRLNEQLTNHKKYFFYNDKGELDRELVEDFFISLPHRYWSEAKQIFNFNYNEIFFDDTEAVNFLIRLYEKKLDWQLFLNTFAIDKKKINYLLQDLLLKHIDINKWQFCAAGLTITLQELFPNPWEFFHRIPANHWKSFANLININNYFLSGTDLIQLLNHFNDSDKSLFIETFAIKSQQFFSSRERLIRFLVDNLKLLPISNWPSFFSLLEIKQEDLFANREQLIDLFMNYLPIEEWDNFQKFFDAEKKYDLKKHDLFNTREELFAFMEKTKRTNWNLLFSDFEEVKLNRLMTGQETMSTEILCNLLNQLNYREKTPSQKKYIAYCAYEVYWTGWRKKQGNYTTYAGALTMSANMSAKGLGVRICQKFCVSDFPPDATGWDSFITQYCKEEKLTVEYVNGIIFENHLWGLWGTTLCSITKEVLGMIPQQVAANKSRGLLGIFNNPPTEPVPIVEEPKKALQPNQ